MPPEIREKQFHNQLAEATSDLIAKRLNIYPKQALNFFPITNLSGFNGFRR